MDAPFLRRLKQKIYWCALALLYPRCAHFVCEYDTETESCGKLLLLAVARVSLLARGPLPIRQEGNEETRARLTYKVKLEV